ncbi:MAG: FIST N-terminal domain-containing protein [Elusimicrobiota bacterium]|jgi:hypothetical protein
MSIEFGVGISSLAEVFAAGQEAANQMVSQLGTQLPDLILVFSSIRFANPRLLKGIRSVAGHAPLIGCTDAGGISAGGVQRHGVTVIGLAAKGAQFFTGVGRNLSRDPVAAGEHLARDLFKQTLEKPVALLTFPDGLAPDGAAILMGFQKVFGPDLPVVGGNAADDFYFQKTFQYFDNEVLTDSAPAALFCGDILVGVGVRHGWAPLGRPRRVTRSAGHVIYQLDKRPAVSIYEDYLGLKRESLEEPLAHTAIIYPLGTAVAGREEYLLREAVRVGHDGSLICTGSLPVGCQVRLMIGGYASVLEAAQQATLSAVETIGRERLKGALTFCNVARQKMLGSECQDEISIIQDAMGGECARLGGFYTYGELAPLPLHRGRHKFQNTFHNESVVVMALG